LIGTLSANALVGVIYKKQLRLSAASNKVFSTGEIVNFLQTDTQKLLNLS